MMQPGVLGCGEPSAVPKNPATLYEPVAGELARVDEILAAELRSQYPFVNALVDHVAGYGGKRLRPALLLLAGKAAGELCEHHLALAAVVEMIHTATLVHDDILDDAVVRRHRATVNAEWGNESSVLLGDYLFTHAFHLAAGTGSTLACRLIGRATNIVCEGELYQIHQRGNLELSEPEYFAIIGAKTAELCAVSCRLGAHFAGSSPELEESLVRYGRNLGSAFQIADDLLDLLGEERRTGKSLGSDVEQQKLTLPLIWLMQHGAPAAIHAVRRVLSERGNHKREQLGPILQSSGALQYARRQADRFAAAAARELETLPDSAAKQSLATLSRFVVRRSA